MGELKDCLHISLFFLLFLKTFLVKSDVVHSHIVINLAKRAYDE